VTIVVSPSAFGKLREIIEKFKGEKVIITTYGVSYALENKIDIDFALDLGVKVRAYSHKPSKISNLSIYESEALLVAKDIEAVLVVGDEKVKEEAEKMGVKTILV
jgi:predicted DNA-binding protein (UPF0278 family)